MSLMRINHVANELKKLKYIVEKLIKDYESFFKDYDSEYEQENSGMEQKIEFENCIDSLKTFAQFQNELILVKHVALIESMIIQLFSHLVILLNRQDYQEKYFETTDNFSDIFVAVKKISEITEKGVNIKKIKFWYFYDIMRNIRHSVAHGEPLFIMSHKKVEKFNSTINIISLYSEKNGDPSTSKFYPSLLQPTYSDSSEWYCHLSSNINGLSILNEECHSFVQEIRGLYLSYGKNKNISEHDLYARAKIGKPRRLG